MGSDFKVRLMKQGVWADSLPCFSYLGVATARGIHMERDDTQLALPVQILTRLPEVDY